jgi:uncharacterized protein (TIGR02246 family)
MSEGVFMKRSLGLFSGLLALGLLVAMADPRGRARGAAHDGDEKEIRALLQQLGEAWNRHDVKAFMERVAADADAVNRFGQWFHGRPELEKHLTELHAAPFRDMLVDRSSKVEQVRFLTPEVAVAHERAEEKAGRSIRTYVLQRRDGRWWIQSADIIQEGRLPAH